MKITWDWSLAHESDRLLEMSLKVSNGFYHLHHFLVLPFAPKHPRPDSSHHVYLPDLPYSSIPRYWESVSKVGDIYPLKQLANISNLLETHLESLSLAPLHNPTLISDTKLDLPKVVDWLHSTFPSLPLPDDILIHPSYFGTLGSFDWNQKTNQVVLYLRSDQTLYTLVELVLSAILRPHAGETLYSDWEKTEYLVDYLLLESSLRDLLPSSGSWQPTTIPPHYPQALVQESNQFLQKMGVINHTSTHFSLKDGGVYFGATPLTTLTAREHSILTQLISRAPNPLTIDEIADLIFTKEEKFSLAAIGKTIERLRKKLSDLGISSSYLATASGVGYYLKN